MVSYFRLIRGASTASIQKYCQEWILFVKFCVFCYNTDFLLQRQKSLDSSIADRLSTGTYYGPLYYTYTLRKVNRIHWCSSLTVVLRLPGVPPRLVAVQCKVISLDQNSILIPKRILNWLRFRKLCFCGGIEKEGEMSSQLLNLRLRTRTF